MNHELARLNKERKIIEDKKYEAEKAYFAAENQRTRMRQYYDSI